MKKESKSNSQQFVSLNHPELKKLSHNCNSILGISHKTLFTENLLQGEILTWEAKWKKEKGKNFFIIIYSTSLSKCL